MWIWICVTLILCSADIILHVLPNAKWAQVHMDLFCNLWKTFIMDSFFFVECKTTPTERNYFGSISSTISGFTCQRWDSQSPHPHSFTHPDRFPDASVEASQNYCRNPDGKLDGSWCYTEDPFVECEYCDIPSCSGNHAIKWLFRE